MRLVLVIVAGLAFAVLSACASNPTVKTAFSPNEASRINDAGEYSFSGQAFLRQRGGQVVYAAGSPVALIPRTRYADEVMKLVFSGSGYQPSPPKIENLDSRYLEMRRKTIANGEGRFRFSNLPAGQYYVVTPVSWEVSTGYGSRTEGGLLKHLVSLPQDNNTEVVMTH